MSYMNYKDLDDLLESAKSYEDKDAYISALEIYLSLVDFLDLDRKLNIYYKIADIYLILEDYQSSKDIYKKIIDIDEDQPGAWYGLALSYEELGDNKSLAIEAYKNAIDLDPDYKEAHYNLGILYSDLELYEEAIEHFTRVLELDPFDFICENDLGSIYEKSKDYDLALVHIDRSISINNNYYMSHFNRGVVLERLGRFKEAIESYNRARELSDNIYIYLNMSALYIKLDKLTSALDILNIGIKEYPHHILYYNRACVKAKLNDLDGARLDYNRAKELNDIVKSWAINDPDLKFLKEF